MTERVAGIFYDVDETVYDNAAGRVPELTRHALNNLTVPAWMATGRSLPLAIKLKRHGVNLTGHGVLDSGATIADFDNQKIAWQRWLEAQKVTEVLHRVGRRCLDISTATMQERVQVSPSAIDRDFSYGQQSPSVFGVFGLGERRSIEDELQEVLGIHYRFTRYENSQTRGCFQVTAEGVDKQSGVLRMARMLGYQGEPLGAIGDSYQGDWPIFAAVRALGQGSVTIAMGNADERLKQEADIVVPGIQNVPDGFSVGMRQLGVVKK